MDVEIEEMARSWLVVRVKGSVYVVEQDYHRLMHRLLGAKQGKLIFGARYTQESRRDQFNRPTSISSHDRGNLYVVDRDDDRIQRFDLQ